MPIGYSDLKIKTSPGRGSTNRFFAGGGGADLGEIEGIEMETTSF